MLSSQVLDSSLTAVRSGQGRDRQGGDREEQQGGHRPNRRRVEPLRPVSQPADQECLPQDQQGVGQDRADQRRLDDDDQSGLEREDRDEQFEQVAERRLEDPGSARSEPLTQLIGP